MLGMRKSLGMGKGQAIYRLRGQIPVSKGQIRQVYQSAVAAILEFCMRECVNSLPREAWELADFDVRELNCSAECRAIPEIFVWTLRLRFIKDEKTDERDDISESHTWHYDIAIAEEGGQLEFGLEVSVEQGFSFPFFDYQPLLVSLLAEKVGLRQGRVLDGRPMIVRDDADAEQLYDLLTYRGRNLPVVVISEVNHRAWTFTPNPPAYLIDSSVFAARSLGYAHVVQMSYEGSRAWTLLSGTAWTVFDGAVRIFKPNFDINFGNPGEHQIFLKNDIWDFRHDRVVGSKAFFAYMLAALRRHSSQMYINWRGLLFQPGASAVKSVLAKMDQAGKAAAAAEREKTLLGEISKLEHELADAIAQKLKCEEKLLCLTERNKELETTASSMQSSIEQLSGFGNTEHNAVRDSGEIEIPDSYGDMAAWVELYLHGRLYLHPRAERVIEKAEYLDSGLVYRSLLALAFEYRDSRLGKCGEKDFKARCSELGIQKRGAISKSRIGVEKDQYYVNYPPHTSKRRQLRWHLVKGNSRLKAYCMRIYFFWDGESKQVVVGYLPGHLNNRIS